MYYFDTLPPVSPTCWMPDSGLTFEEENEFFKAYRREVRLAKVTVGRRRCETRRRMHNIR